MKKLKQFIKNEIILSILFALGIFIILILSESFFIYKEYNRFENDIKDKLVVKTKIIKTIIKNKDTYIDKNNDYTLFQIVKKSLENSLITKNGKISNNFFPENINDEAIEKILKIDNKGFLNFGIHKIYKTGYNDSINIYVISEKDNNYKYFLNVILLFIFIDIIIFIFSGLIGYIFIKKILKKIENNLKNLKEFTNDINHELKTPLAIIKSSLELYKKENGENEYIKDALNATNNINSTISSIGEIAFYMENYNNIKESIFIKKEIDKIIKIYKKSIEKKSIKINVDIEIKQTIYVQKNDLLICISNMLKNAIKYSHKNGEIIIKISKKTIEIIDSGLGIDKKNLNKIFDRFYSDKKDFGTGIGLSIIQKIIDKNGWKIEVESKKGIKTVFKIKF